MTNVNLRSMNHFHDYLTSALHGAFMGSAVAGVIFISENRIIVPITTSPLKETAREDKIR